MGGIRAVATSATVLAVTAALAGPAWGSAATEPGAAALQQMEQRQAAVKDGTLSATPLAADEQAVSASSMTSMAVSTATCPVGLVRGRTVYANSFETAVPDGLVGGFERASGSAAAGTYFARSDLSGPAGNDNEDMVIEAGAVAPGTRTYVSFTSRGDFAAESAYLHINDMSGWVDASPDWNRYTIDITSETGSYDGDIYMMFDHYLDEPTATAQWDVDDVQVFTCTTPPASGVRGDWTGEGTVDVLATRSDGTLWLYPGRNDGSVSSGMQVGNGWGSMTWIGSPGDVNGDRRTDLVARRSDGTLWLYLGRGAGAFQSGRQIGSKWNAMTAIVTPGDLDGSSSPSPDLIARRSDGTMHFYRFNATGGLRYVNQVGTSWNSMTWIVGMGDLNGDARGDVVAVRNDGVMFSYRWTGSRLTLMSQVGGGWRGMTWLTSPGDMNRDGRGDLIARRSDGTLWFYAGKASGLVSGKQVGSGWNVMTRII